MISVQHLSKEFKKPIRKEGVFGMFKTLFSHKYEVKKAVDDINFDIQEGEIIGYIGSNGAGKSTTIKMMCGILNPTSGKVLINGLEPYKKRQVVAKDIGVVFGQKTQLWWDIPLIESFKVLKEIYLVSDEDFNERMKFFEDNLGIKEFISQPVRTLSLGQRMRADLAASLIHNPKILFLDEPTIGLDVLVKERIRNAILEMNRQFKTTIILTTHDMSDIEKLCTRLIIIDKGHIIYDGNQEGIKNKFGDLRTIEASIEDDVDLTTFDTFKDKVVYTIKDRVLTVRFDAQEVKVEKVMAYVLKQVHLKDIKIKEISIEDVTRELYKNEEKD